MKKTLIINADDFGMTLPISKGIIDVCKIGFVKSTSAITNSKDFLLSISELNISNTKIDVGFHANLTWGIPILGKSEISSLIDENGCFFPKATLLLKCISGKISEKEIYKELSAQCEILRKSIGKISHMDSHHHTHTFPVIRDAIEKVARDFQIKIIRAPKESKWIPWKWAFLRRLAINSLKSSSPSYWTNRGFVCANNFGGFALGSSPNIRLKWNHTLEILPDGITEIMVHPGYKSNNKDSYNHQREDEISILKDLSLLNKAKDLGINITSFAESFGE